MKIIYTLLILFSTIVFSQHLKVELYNQEVLLLKNNQFQKNIILTKDTSMHISRGLYNFFNDSINYTIYVDGLNDCVLSFSDGYNTPNFKGINSALC